MPPKNAGVLKTNAWNAVREGTPNLQSVPGFLAETSAGTWVLLRKKTPKELEGSDWRNKLDPNDPKNRLSAEMQNDDVYPAGCNGLPTGIEYYGQDLHPDSLYGVDVYVRYPN